MVSFIDFQFFLLPVLESVKDEELYQLESIIQKMAYYAELSDGDIPDLMKDRKVFDAMVTTAVEHLTKAKLIECSSQDSFRITSFGKMILSKRLNSIDIEFLRRLGGVD